MSLVVGRHGPHERSASTLHVLSAEDGPHSTAHVVPESLAGRNAPVGRPGATCNACNQYFGQKVESKALRSFPFIGCRILAGVPSKKGAFPHTGTSIGAVHATGVPGIVELQPRDNELSCRVSAGEVSQLRLVAEVTEPLAVCRMLLKIGIEQLGKHFFEVAISDRMLPARQFARRPVRGSRWWFILQSKPSEYVLGSGAPLQFSVEIFERDGVLVSALHIAGISSMIPLEPRALPPAAGELPEPEFRTVWAVC